MHAKFYNECTLNNQIITAVYDLLGQPSYIENPRIISADGSEGSDFLGNHINKTIRDCFMLNVGIHVQDVCVQILI